MSGNSEQITEVEIMSFVFCFRIPVERIPQSDMIGQTKTRPNLKTKTMEILMNHVEVFIQTLGHYSRISHINMGIATHAAEKKPRTPVRRDIRSRSAGESKGASHDTETRSQEM